MQRFNKNNFFVEKNPTIVNFPIKYVGLCDVEIKITFDPCRDIDMAEFLSSDAEVQDAHPHSIYDLVANICHDGQPGKD